MFCPHGQLNQDVPRNIHIEFCMISVILKPKRQTAHPGSLPFAGEARGPAAVQIPRMDVDVLPRAQKAPVLPKAQGSWSPAVALPSPKFNQRQAVVSETAHGQTVCYAPLEYEAAKLHHQQTV